MSVVMCCKKFVYARVFVSFVIAQAKAKTHWFQASTG